MKWLIFVYLKVFQILKVPYWRKTNPSVIYLPTARFLPQYTYRHVHGHQSWDNSYYVSLDDYPIPTMTYTLKPSHPSYLQVFWAKTIIRDYKRTQKVVKPSLFPAACTDGFPYEELLHLP